MQVVFETLAGEAPGPLRELKATVKRGFWEGLDVVKTSQILYGFDIRLFFTGDPSKTASRLQFWKFWVDVGPVLRSFGPPFHWLLAISFGSAGFLVTLVAGRQEKPSPGAVSCAPVFSYIWD